MATISSVSPLAPAQFPTLSPVKGVRFSTIAAGIKYEGRTDVMLAQLDPGTTVAGVFTRSATRAAPVLDCQSKIGGDPTRGAAILVNSGNANAFTGRNGLDAVAAIASATARACKIPETRVFTASTGVIGEPLPFERITDHLEALSRQGVEDGAEAAARAIMTTDTFAKGATAQVDINGETVTITGIAKGSGMIAPDMATMLVYIFTDAQIAQSDLQTLVATHNDQTFNCITVDSDTSTSDTLIVAATGASGIDVTSNADFSASLRDVMLELAHLVVKDGEGATKFVEISVSGAASVEDAKRHALSVANSPLVKTAVAGEDPNWGRVVMAVGKSGAAADRDLLAIRFGDVQVAENGWVSPSYVEAEAAAHMKEEKIRISIDIGIGDGAATVWTCDLTHGYIQINADYRS